MNAIEIIRAKVSAEGFPIERRVLQEAATKRVASGQDLVLQYGDTVFTVSIKGIVHMYSVENGPRVVRALRRFHRDVWWLTPHLLLHAPISNRKLQRIALRFGWKETDARQMGFTWFILKKEH